MENSKYESINWYQFDWAIEQICEKLKETGKEFDRIYGIPRAGLIVAVALSHKLGIPISLYPLKGKTLIVDDIADKGRTLRPFREKGFFICTLHYKPRSTVIPDIYIWKTNNGTWIRYPWETEESTREGTFYEEEKQNGCI